MLAQDIEHSWIPLRDYVVRGIRKEKEFVNPMMLDPALQPFPETWIAASDWVRQAKPDQTIGTDTDWGEALSLSETVYPDTRWTVYRAMANVYAVLEQSAIVPTVQRMQELNRHDCDRGLISRQEQQHRDEILHEIHNNHFANMDNIVSWYMDTYFRMFESGG